MWKMQTMKIFIDNGHGSDTAGKRSPDGRFLEYKFNRKIAAHVVSDLLDRGYDAELLVPELEDISLTERCRRVNAVCDAIGTNNVLLISIHVNAAGSDGQWHNATGWSAYTTPGITRSDLLAFDLYEAAKKHLANQKLRLFNGPKKPNWEANFYLLRHTKCPAVLTENMFMDNKGDVIFLESHTGKQAIIDLHVGGIIEYLYRVY